MRLKEWGGAGLQDLSRFCICMSDVQLNSPLTYLLSRSDLSNEIQEFYFLKSVSDGYDGEIKDALTNSANLLRDFYVSVSLLL